MAAIASLSDLVNRMSGGNNGTPETVFAFKVARAGGVNPSTPSLGRMFSYWTYDGMPASGAVPTAGAIPTRTTVGALPFTAPGGSRQKWLVNVAAVPTIAGTLILYDRLYHIGGLSGTLTTDQTVQGSTPSPALTRNTGGAGNHIFYEIYTQVGSTSRTLTVTYTDQDGNTGQTATINIGGTDFAAQTRVQRIPLAAGDTGVRAVEKVALSASTGTTGNFGITIGRPLAQISIGTASSGGWRDFTTGLPGLPEIDSDACLAMYYTPSSASVSEMWLTYSMVEA
jgi:hypothetical protein